MESPAPLNPYGMKGAGESGATGSPAAAAGAIADALGVKITDDGPFSPARIIAQLSAAERPWSGPGSLV